MKICPNCKSQMNDAAAFCTVCGTPLTDVAPAAAPEAEAVPASPQAPQGGYAPPQGGYAPFQGGYVPPQGGYAPPQGGYVPPQGYAYQGYAPQAPKHPIDEFDHTQEFDAADVSENKPYAILIYLTSLVGMLLALLAARDSDYIKFHIRQGVKLLVVETAVGLFTGLLCWTIIVPIAGAVAIVTLLVVQIICFFRACKGQSREVPIVCKLGFLK